MKKVISINKEMKENGIVASLFMVVQIICIATNAPKKENLM